MTLKDLPFPWAGAVASLEEVVALIREDTRHPPKNVSRETPYEPPALKEMSAEETITALLRANNLLRQELVTVSRGRDYWKTEALHLRCLLDEPPSNSHR